jgi:hypothetical protein
MNKIGTTQNWDRLIEIRQREFYKDYNKKYGQDNRSKQLPKSTTPATQTIS